MGRRSQRSRSNQPRDRIKGPLKSGEGAAEIAEKPVDISSAGGKEADKRKKDKQREKGTESGLEGGGADAIAAGYASIEVEQNPQTCCSNCKTIFEVSQELLASSDTRVRCGECLSIFDALANLRQASEEDGSESESELSDEMADHVEPSSAADTHSVASSLPNASAAALAGLANNASSLDVTYADFSLFSADAALPDIDYMDETVEVQSFDFDDPGGDDELDDTYSETLFAHGPEVDARSAIDAADTSQAIDEQASGPTPVDAVSSDSTTAIADPAEEGGDHDDTLSATIAGDGMDELLDSLERAELPSLPVQAVPVSSGVWKARGVMLLLLVTLAVALYGYRERQSLQHNRYLRPILEAVCFVIDCTLAEQVDLDSLQVLKRSVFSHPTIDNALIINIGFINKASFGQRYPVVDILLTDRNGRLIVKNSFEPSDYLDNWQPGDVFAADAQIDVTLNVDDPGNDARSFELDFR